MCDESLTRRGLNSNSGHFRDSAILPFSYGESCLLVSLCVGDRCDMADIDEDCGRSSRPGIDDRGWSSTGQVLGGRTIGRSGDTMCDLHRTHGNKEREFFG
jgi:hypothetical protein